MWIYVFCQQMHGVNVHTFIGINRKGLFSMFHLCPCSKISRSLNQKPQNLLSCACAVSKVSGTGVWLPWRALPIPNTAPLPLASLRLGISFPHGVFKRYFICEYKPANDDHAKHVSYTLPGSCISQAGVHLVANADFLPQ